MRILVYDEVKKLSKQLFGTSAFAKSIGAVVINNTIFINSVTGWLYIDENGKLQNIIVS